MIEGADLPSLIAQSIRDVPDFPTPGILFKDITPLLADSAMFTIVIDGFENWLAEEEIDVDLVAGIEARGFLLAGALAGRLGCGLLPVRKAGKLPPPTIRRQYQLEYGTAAIEVPVHAVAAKRVLVVDDVLATGGTMRAAADLIVEAGGALVGLAVLLELGFLNGREALAGLPDLTALLTV